NTCQKFLGFCFKGVKRFNFYVFLNLVNLRRYMEKPLKYAVFGSGSWATAIVKMLCENLDEVGWYMRSVYTKEHLLKEQHNPSYLSSVEFNIKQLKLSNDINDMVAYADVLIFVIPSAFMYSELEKITEDVSKKTIVSAVKGIIP